jgi:hypothetical protein
MVVATEDASHIGLLPEDKKMTLESLLDDSFSLTPRSPESQSHSVGRRQFLQTVGVAGAALALTPKLALAQHSEFARWRDTVNDFVYTVCTTERRAGVITARLRSISLKWAPEYRDFHYYHAAPLIFVDSISPEQVICGNGFQVNQYPFYDELCPCGSVADLNAYEIRRVINAGEIERFKCVLTPHGRRMPVEGYADHANYRRAAEPYPINPDDYKPVAKRLYRKKNGRAVVGYQIADKRDLAANVKPKMDMLLSSSDF